MGEVETMSAHTLTMAICAAIESRVGNSPEDYGILDQHDNAALRLAEDISATVVAHLQSDAAVEQRTLAAWRAEGGPAWETCGDNYRAMIRASDAALLAEPAPAAVRGG